ncbi:MAG: fumarylacetoacetate hydrolase family protein [Anaerolineae bacterium]|nr:fumarylacetoacetate hydrolase family protein [Anaerolineae bacterium]
MYLTRHCSAEGAQWALDGALLPPAFNLGLLLEMPYHSYADVLPGMVTGQPARGERLAPVELMHEVWASGVTYLRSRDARQAESESGDIYARVYEAERPELFMKAVGWRVMGPEDEIRVRPDSNWNVPEPELTLVINRYQEIVGYTAGNDVSSRSIEGANPLYLPQAKVYRGSCALGPGIRLASPGDMRDLPIALRITRDGAVAFEGQTSTAQMKRTFEDLVSYLCRELPFPRGVFLMTGTGLVPPDEFTLQPGDVVRVVVGELVLENRVAD